MWIAVLLGCTEPDPEPPGDGPDPAGDTDLFDTDTEPPPSTADTATASTPTADTASPLDCSVLPPAPVSYTTIGMFTTAEDFDFDGLGYHVSNYTGSLWARNLASDTRIISPGLGNIAGTRMLATGDWVLADAGSGELILVDGTTGGQSTIWAGMSWPNGIEVDSDNELYVTDFSNGLVVQLNAYKPVPITIASGLDQPNGIVLSPDEQTLYVLLSWTAAVLAFDRDKDGSWGEPRMFHLDTDGNYQGINVDMCGNVYWTDIRGGINRIMRKTPDGSQLDRMVELPSSYVPNLRWGDGVDGFETDLLYASDRDEGRLFAIEAGIDGRPHILLR